ncbi:MAG: hypothetical protein J2P45_12455 [Candidatus Dormibacteraeota bacterium]|nr:hypothetical protein [Candidatus Dormibacteraeota bacterium]
MELPDPLLSAEAWERLRLVYDPELGVNVVLQAVERALSTIPGVRGVAVELVWEPPWTPEMMTEPARRALGRT